MQSLHEYNDLQSTCRVHHMLSDLTQESIFLYGSISEVLCLTFVVLKTTILDV